MLWIDFQMKALAYHAKKQREWKEEGVKMYYQYLFHYTGKKKPESMAVFLSNWTGEKRKMPKKVWDKEIYDKAIKAYNS